MLVTELIEALQKVPQHARVFVFPESVAKGLGDGPIDPQKAAGFLEAIQMLTIGAPNDRTSESAVLLYAKETILNPMFLS
jgi:hypothetical protein